MPFGAELRGDGSVRFRLWAPAVAAVAVELPAMGRRLEMRPLPQGWHELVTAAAAGDPYLFVLPDGTRVADPASRCQALDADGPSLVVDAGAYRWRNETWLGRPWREAVIYELHVGTFTPAGTFAGVANRLPYLADLGVSAIELMPIADFAGARNWGYDGVLPFAPDRAYGTPEDLKALIDQAHGLGLMMLLDVVDNHFGPAGNALGRYAPDFFTDDLRTPWGAAIDFRVAAVREFYVHNALYWLREYRFDGLRFDAVHAIFDPSPVHILTELARRVRTEVAQEVHLVLENERNQACLLRRDPVLGRRLYGAQWNDDLHHAAHALITGERTGYYADFADGAAERLRRALTEGFVYQGEPSPCHGGQPRGEPSADLPPTAFVGFLQNHDQIGNRALGERLTALAPPDAVRACQSLLLLSPQVPLLFMGEEWGTHTPFLYFCDFAGELAERVRQGRREEFAAFFADLEAVPDPLDPDTFARSRLEWHELADPAHSAWLARTRKLLRLRAQRIAPHLVEGEVQAGRSESLGHHGMHISWTLAGGRELTLLANLGPEPLDAPEPPTGELLHATHSGWAEMLPAWFVAWSLRGDA